MWLGAKLFGSRRWAFALHAEQKPEDGYVGVDLSVREEIGKQGIAVTDLRPAGKVEVGGEVYDACLLYTSTGSRISNFQHPGYRYTIIQDKTGFVGMPAVITTK